MTSKSKQKKHYLDPNSIEAVSSYGSDTVVSSVLNSTKQVSDGFFDQLLGIGEYKPEPAEHQSGDLSEGQELVLHHKQEQIKEEVHHLTEAGEEYKREILHPEKKVSREEYEESAQVEQILAEIKKLIATSQELQAEYGHVAVEQVQKKQKKGKYEVVFFDWLLLTIRQARMKAEDSANYLRMFASKKKQQGYWNQFKKHGTSFGMSHERAVATQTG